MSTQEDWDAKVDEIAAHVARELYGPGPYTDAEKLDAREAAEDAVEDWERATIARDEPLIAVDPLQRLLAEQHDIAEAIMDGRNNRLPK
jgi:hypothetical protein